MEITNIDSSHTTNIQVVVTQLARTDDGHNSDNGFKRYSGVA